MEKITFLAVFTSIIVCACSTGDDARPSSFSGVVFEYASDKPLEGVPVTMYASNSPRQLNFLSSTQTDSRGNFYFEPEVPDSILAYFYRATMPGYSIRPPNQNAIAYLNEAPNYDTLIAFEEAFLKIVVNPEGDTDQGWFSVNVYSDEYQLGFPLLNRKTFQDSVKVQTAVMRLFKTKGPVTVFWSINFQDFSREIELLARDTVTLSINY